MTDPEPDRTSAAPPPKPAPRPGPRPASPGKPSPATSTTNNPRKFGRVDPDGTVWLISAGGERTIGSWQAGDTEAAFEYFGRRYEDLSTEVHLLEQRLASGTGDARKIKASAAGLAEGLASAAVLGDVDSLGARLNAIQEHAVESVQAEKARRDEHRVAQIARKDALAVEAEDIAANSTHWKSAGDRLRTILDEWRTITGIDRKTDDALWKRYSAAREAFNRRRGSHFADMDRQRATVRQTKEQLCEQAEALADSTDWGKTSTAFRDLLAQWKTSGRTSKDIDDSLWHRFKPAQDTFFKARNAANAVRGAELQANAEAKQKLLAQAEKIGITDLDAARSTLRSIAEKWDSIGRVPRERSADLERRLRSAEKRVRDAADSGWRDPQAQQRAEQFRARAEQFERQAEKARAAGRTADAEEAEANAGQWRQWAEAAANALSKKR